MQFRLTTPFRRVLIAPDKFKGTLAAGEAARAMSAGLKRFCAEEGFRPEILVRPLADGGEGSHETLKELEPGLVERRMALTPAVGDARPIPYLARDNDRYLETALVIGLELPGSRDVPVEERRTNGVGEWIASMIEEAPNVERLDLHLFLGGSATSDGGFGVARALGFRFLVAL